LGTPIVSCVSFPGVWLLGITGLFALAYFFFAFSKSAGLTIAPLSFISLTIGGFNSLAAFFLFLGFFVSSSGAIIYVLESESFADATSIVS
jgi:hypothetical protein